jgi:hypothetical protein
VHFWKGPPGGQALLQFWKHLQNLNSFSAAVKKRQGCHAVSHSYWPVNGTLTGRYEIKFFLCYAVSYVASTCRDMRSDRSAQQSSLEHRSMWPERCPVHITCCPWNASPKQFVLCTIASVLNFVGEGENCIKTWYITSNYIELNKNKNNIVSCFLLSSFKCINSL